MNHPSKFLILRHIEGNSLSHLSKVFDQKGLDYIHHQGQALEKNGWPRPAEFDGLVILGGYEHLPKMMEASYIQHEIEFIRQMIHAQKPVLGICLGAQLIAASLGASVHKNPVKERGWHALNLTQAGENDPVLGPLGNPFIQFHWHEDTYDLPQGAIQLAQSETCLQQAFRYGPLVYGVQFHPEIDEPTIRMWLGQSKTLSSKEKTDILAGMEKHLIRQQSANRAMLHRFLDQWRHDQEFHQR